MADDSEFSELVGLIYDAAFDRQLWSSALMRLADTVGGWAVRLGFHDTRTQAFTGEFPRTDSAYIQTYLDHWAHQNTSWQRAAEMPVGTIMRGAELITRAEFIRTDFYNEWVKPQEIDWVLGAKLAQQGSTTVILSIYRPFRIDDFDRNHIAVWRTFIPHLQRALQLQLRLASLEANYTTSLEVLNRLRQGVLLVDSAARVVFANRAAEMMFTEGNGLRIDVDGLHAASPAATAALRKLIAECAQEGDDPKGSGGAIALPRGAGRIPLNGLVIPLRATTGWLHFNRPTSIIFITDPERQHVVREAHLRGQFDLTKAEAAFVVEILRGEGLQASADRLGISLSTARTHLSHVFDKTGTKRQAELVRFILQGQTATYDE